MGGKYIGRLRFHGCFHDLQDELLHQSDSESSRNTRARDEDRCGRSEYLGDSIQDVRVEGPSSMHECQRCRDTCSGADSSSRPKVMSPGSGINTYSPRNMHGKSAHSCRKDLARPRPCHRMRLHS